MKTEPFAEFEKNIDCRRNPLQCKAVKPDKEKIMSKRTPDDFVEIDKSNYKEYVFYQVA